jgi:hypothetical protein
VSPNISGTTEGSGGTRVLADGLGLRVPRAPQRALVDVGIPQATGCARQSERAPRRIERSDRGGIDEDLVLDHQRNLRPTVFDVVVRVDQVVFEVVTDDVGRSDAGVGVEPRRAEGVVVVPHQARALLVRVIELGLARESPWIEYRVVQEAGARHSG